MGTLCLSTSTVFIIYIYRTYFIVLYRSLSSNC